MILQNLFTKIAKTPARAAATLPKTPVQAKGAPKPPGASKGRPRKKTGKENENNKSPLGGATNGSALAPSSDPATGDDVPTSVAEENHVLRERLAEAECELIISFYSDSDLTYLCSESCQCTGSRTQASPQGGRMRGFRDYRVGKA